MRLVLLAAVCCCAACSWDVALRRAAQTHQAGAADRTAAAGSSASTAAERYEASAEAGRSLRAPATDVPFALEVVDEFNDGRFLNVRARLRSHTPWDGGGMMLRAAGLRAGQIVRSREYSLQDLKEQGRARGSYSIGAPGPLDVTVQLELPAEGLTDYQIELLWGDEAAVVESTVAAVKLELRDVRVEKRLQCAQAGAAQPAAGIPRVPVKSAGCVVHFLVHGRLVNEGGSPIETAVLGVGFVPAGSGPEAAVPQSESQVEIAGLSLTPSAGRVFRLQLDQTLTEEQGRRLLPAVRLLSFK